MTDNQDRGQSPQGELQEKMWRAIRMNRSFTAFDLAMYSGATLDYAKKYISFLLGHGLLRKVGREGQKAKYGHATDLPPTPPAWRRKRATGELEKRPVIHWGNAMMQAIRAGDLEKAVLAHEVVGQKLQLLLGKNEFGD